MPASSCGPISASELKIDQLAATIFSRSPATPDEFTHIADAAVA